MTKKKKTNIGLLEKFSSALDDQSDRKFCMRLIRDFEVLDINSVKLLSMKADEEFKNNIRAHRAQNAEIKHSLIAAISGRIEDFYGRRKYVYDIDRIRAHVDMKPIEIDSKGIANEVEEWLRNEFTYDYEVMGLLIGMNDDAAALAFELRWM